MLFDSYYAYTIMEIVLNCLLDKVSYFLEYNLVNSLVITSVLQIFSLFALSIKWLNRRYTYRLSERTIVYLILLTLTMCVKHNIRLYAKSIGIPFYKNYVLKTLYFGFKPFFNYYFTMSSYNWLINLAHLVSILPVVVYNVDQLLSITLFTSIFEMIDLFVLDELENKFYIEMLMPEVYLFVENLGEFISNLCILYKEGLCIEYMTTTNWWYAVLFVLVEFFTIGLTLVNTRVKKYTIEKQKVLLQLDAHISNSIDICFNFIYALCNAEKKYVYNAIYYLLDTHTVINGAISLFHLWLYIFEVALYYI